MGFFSNIVGSFFFLAGGPGGLGHEGQTEIYDFYFRFAKNHQMVQCTGVAIFLDIFGGVKLHLFQNKQWRTNPNVRRKPSPWQAGGAVFIWGHTVFFFY